MSEGKIGKPHARQRQERFDKAERQRQAWHTFYAFVELLRTLDLSPAHELGNLAKELRFCSRVTDASARRKVEELIE